jgi:hypothetical protein
MTVERFAIPQVASTDSLTTVEQFSLERLHNHSVKKAVLDLTILLKDPAFVLSYRSGASCLRELRELRTALDAALRVGTLAEPWRRH